LEMSVIASLSLALLAISAAFACVQGWRRHGKTPHYSGRTEVIEGMSDGVLVVDMNDRLLDLNLAAKSILSLHDTTPDLQPLGDVIAHHPDLVELFRGAIDGRTEMALRRDDGEELIYDLQLTALYDDSGEISSRILVLRDNSERIAYREELKRETTNVQLLQQVAVAANDAVTIDGALAQCVQQICDVTDWSVGHVLKPTGGKAPALEPTDIWFLRDDERRAEFINPENQCIRSVHPDLAERVCNAKQPAYNGEREASTRQHSADPIDDSAYISVAFPVLVHDGTFAVLEFITTAQRKVDSHLLYVFGHLGSLIGRAIERKLDAAKIRKLAFRDSLTQLPNRQYFRESLDEAVARSERLESLLGLLFIDLDGFKRVNDNLGHSAGDGLLCQVAERFASVIRQSDQVGCSPTDGSATPGDDEPTTPLARLGGDEFTLILNDITRPEDAARVAERLIAALRDPITISGHEFFIGASIGIATYPNDGDSAETLLQCADAAMYFAKDQGRNCYQFYTQNLNESSARRLVIEEHLRGALERGEFSLRYQPLRESATNKIVAVEALLRWEDPQEGFIGPDEFIPIAEESGMIVPLGAWVLREACLQAQRWREEGYRPIRMSVNLSGRQIRARNLVDTVRDILEETQMSPHDLELEITESTIMQDDELTTQSLCRLDEMGIGLALDDFGTGYSSINYLRHFPIRRLKIDRSFVSDLMTDPDAAALTGAIIAMAHSLRVAVVGEGVESEAQAYFLRERGCEELQGYLISRPVDSEGFRRFLVKEKDSDEPDGEFEL
jgi:predicted signal transduction protein with EAL and GGDEF domain